MDLGCGRGDLLARLVDEKKVRAEGIEINEESIRRCIAKGLSVFHKDIDEGLPEYATQSFDHVILNQTLQQVWHLERVLGESLRVGKKVIVGFPNFTHYRARLQILLAGKTPITPSLPHRWYDTPNLHFLSIADFVGYCREKGIRIERSAYFANGRAVRSLPNAFALVGLFMISAARGSGHGSAEDREAPPSTVEE